MQPPAGMAGDGMDLMDLLHAAQRAWSAADANDASAEDGFISPAPVRLMLAVASKTLVRAFNHIEQEHRKNQHLTSAKKDRVVSEPPARSPRFGTDMPLTRTVNRSPRRTMTTCVRIGVQP